jgi:transglutaminase-like putative cysteine protease
MQALSRAQPDINTPSNPPSARWWDWVSFLILWALVLVTTNRLSATNWTDDLDNVSRIALYGFFAGTALGFSLFRPLTVSFFSFIYGAFFIGWDLGASLGPDILWTERLYTLFLRFVISLQRLSAHQPVTDNLLFLLLMMILFWVLCCYAGYSLTRHADPWRIILPLALAITLIHSYDSAISRRVGYLVAFSFFALLLLIRLVSLRQLKTWSNANFHIPSQFSLDNFRYGMRVVLLLSLGAWLIPANKNALQGAVAFWEKAKRPFQSVRDDFENAFASLRTSVVTSTDYYGQTLNLGLGNVLTDNEVFTVLVPAKPPQGVRLFWRARVYDHYENGQWSVPNISLRTLLPGSTQLKFPQYPDRAKGLYSFYIAVNQPIVTIFAPPQPQWTNIGSRLEFLPNPDGTVDVFAIRANPPLSSGTTYSVRSSLSGTTVEKLRSAGENYPPWILERYLQLPEEITDRTKNLAQQITQFAPTPYDKVLAITNYLRSNIQYVETLDELPADKELIDWFLFESRKGFCNYYASSEVILLRSLGIPARLAVGFAQGESDESNNRNVYKVLQRDAHAWPEVYFPGIGWVEVEPTSAQPELSRPSSSQETASTTDEETPLPPEDVLPPKPPDKEFDLNQNSALQTYISWKNIFFLLFLLATLILILFYKENIHKVSLEFPIALEEGLRERGITPPKALTRWNIQTRLSPIEKSYLAVNRSLVLLNHPPQKNATPLERSQLLIQVLPEAQVAIEKIIQAYHEAIFHQNVVSESELSQDVKILLNLTWRKKFQQTLLSSPLSNK